MAELVNLTEAARLAGCSRGLLYRAIEDGRLPAATAGRPGRPTLIDVETLRQFCEREGLQTPPLPARQDASAAPGPAPVDVTALLHAVEEFLSEHLRDLGVWLADQLTERLERMLADRDDRLERPGRLGHAERPEHAERDAHPERPGHTGRSARVGHAAQAERSTTRPGPRTLDKAALLPRLRALRAEGLSLQQIATRLNAEGVATLSGRGAWQKGTVGKLLGH